VKKILTFRGWTPVVTLCTAALFVSACSPLEGSCFLCPTDKPFEGALPAQGPTVRAEITRISLWDTNCKSWGCEGRPEVAPDSAGTYALRLGESYYLEIVVHHPGVQYRTLSIQVSQSWGDHLHLVNSAAEREDQVLLSNPSRGIYGASRLPTAVGMYSLHVRVEEQGRDLPTPILIERDLIIQPLP
jgi:hypothetical protein